jgi:hypothetical protein
MKRMCRGGGVKKSVIKKSLVKMCENSVENTVIHSHLEDLICDRLKTFRKQPLSLHTNHVDPLPPHYHHKCLPSFPLSSLHLISLPRLVGRTKKKTRPGGGVKV